MQELKKKLEKALRYKTHRFTIIDSGEERISLTRDDLRDIINLINKPVTTTNEKPKKKSLCHCGSITPKNGCGSLWCPADDTST